MAATSESVNDFEHRGATALRAHGQDTIAFFFPADLDEKRRSGAHPGKTVGAKGTMVDFPLWYQMEPRTIVGVRGMANMLMREADLGQGFPVRGGMATSMEFVRRLKAKSGRCPPAVRDVALHLFPIDADSWPNERNLDPRTQPDETRAWVASILGAEFQGVTALWQWSSSCCARTPAGDAPGKIDCRTYMMLSSPIGEDRVRQLYKRLNARVRAYFLERGYDLNPKRKGREPMLVDSALANCTQPIYLVTPRFVDGLADPFPGSRWALVEGDRDEVDLTVLEAVLPQVLDASAPVPRAYREPGEAKPRGDRRTKRGRVRIPGAVIPLAAAAGLLQAHRDQLAAALTGKDTAAFRDACTNLFHRRAAMEMVAIALHRGGLAEGTRNEFCTMIAAAIVASLPLNRSRAWVRDQVRPLLALVAGAHWVRDEWEGQGFDGSILGRYDAAGRGEKSCGRDPRYTYGKKKLLLAWEPTYEEIRVLGLKSLALNKDRQAAEFEDARDEAGTASRAEWLADARAMAPQVHDLRAAGTTPGAIAEALGLTRSKVLRLLALKDDEVRDARARAVEAQETVSVQPIASPPVPSLASEDDADLVAAVQYAMASQGLEFASEVAEALGLPLASVQAVLRGLADDRDVEMRLAA